MKWAWQESENGLLNAGAGSGKYSQVWMCWMTFSGGSESESESEEWKWVREGESESESANVKSVLRAVLGAMARALARTLLITLGNDDAAMDAWVLTGKDEREREREFKDAWGPVLSPRSVKVKVSH